MQLLAVMKGLLRSSFFWFLVIGALIFAINAQLNNPAYQLIVDDRVVARISALWKSQMGRPPTGSELRHLTDNWVNEELLFREAKRLGLDEEDTIVKRRLIQKMHFLAEEAEVREPNESRLREWFASKTAQYKLPARFTFTQIFYKDAPGPAELALVNLEGKDLAGDDLEGKDLAGDDLAGDAWRERGDASMHNPNFVQQSEREVATELGPLFATHLASMTPADRWQGPVQSVFGWHLVRLDRVDEAATPRFGAVRQQVLNDYLYAQRSAAKQTQLESLKATYKIRWEVTRE